MNKTYLTTSQAARLLGISRIAVFQRIKRGKLKAEKIGRNFAIPEEELLGRELNNEERMLISQGVKKVISDFGETLRRLGKEE